MKLRNLTVGDLMTTALVTVRENDSVAQAELDMRVAGVRHVPVVDERRHLLGILASRDLQRAHAERGSASPVGRFMTRRVFTVTPATPASEAASAMIARKVGALPVLGDDGELVGILTESDLLRVAYQALGGAEAR